MQDIATSLLSVTILIFSAALHEISHGLVALYYGDHTAERAGRLSINPIRHMDLVGSVILPVVLSISGSPFVFGWAKPVPVNYNNLRTAYAPALVALAGPVTNLVLAILSGFLLQYIGQSLDSGFATFLTLVLVINCVLCLFNLLPIPPLDGFHIIEYIFRIPPRITQFLTQYSFVCVLLAVIIFQRFFDGIILTMIRLLTGVAV
jgi:Zn-dependent protease